MAIPLSFCCALLVAGCGDSPAPDATPAPGDPDGSPAPQDSAPASLSADRDGPANTVQHPSGEDEESIVPSSAIAELSGDIPGITENGLLTPDGVTAFLEGFRREAARNAMGAVAESSSQAANARFRSISETVWGDVDPAVGWESFFGAATHSAFPTVDGAVIVAFYNPWSDAVLMTLWGNAYFHPKIVDLELVLADVFRRDGRPPFDLAPAWTAQTGVLPVEAVAEHTIGFVRLLRARFDPADPLTFQRWREAIPSIESESVQLETKRASANAPLRLLGNRLHFLDAEEAAPTREAVSRFLSQIASTRDLPPEFWGPDTLPETIDAIAASPPSQWADFRVACHVRSGDFETVFLYRPDIAAACVSLIFLEDGAGRRLQRTDVVDFHSYFEHAIESIASDPTSGKKGD